MRWLAVFLPLLSLPLYIALRWMLPDHWHDAFVSELGPVEMATAIFFLLAAVLAVRLVRRTELPGRYRAAFGLFAAAALFVGLEELSYGQHLVGWDSPDFFAEQNRQQETNLHNLYGSKPSRRIRSLANVAFPLCFAVLPLCFCRRWGRERPGSWQYYLLPRGELLVLIALATLATAPNKLAVGWFPDDRLTRLGELKELYWSAAACLYAWVMWQRLRGSEQQDSIRSAAPELRQQASLAG